MSQITVQDDAPAVDRRSLVEYLQAGCKPASDWRIGTEHEKFAYRLSDLRPLEYEGPSGIRALLDRLAAEGWMPITEDGHPVALIDGHGCSITLEPGGQVELSGAPLETIHQTCAEIHRHLDQVKAVGADLKIAFIGLGYQPKWPRETLPWMPKGRYRIMRRYMPTRGQLGLDMMQATCTVQVNLDFDSEASMVEMFRIGLALQPVVTALFANSPFRNGRPSGYLSYRSHIWTDTDPDRCGPAPFVFDDGFGFELYVDVMLDMPMYFIYRDGRYIDAAGQSFRQFMRGRLPAAPGLYPTIADWTNHLTTAFFDVRLKRFLEMRGADGGPWKRLCALPALWAGLLYDADARRAAADLVKDWTMAERLALWRDVPRTALKTRFRTGTVADVAMQVLTIAQQGLAARQRRNSKGEDERCFLEPLLAIARSGSTPAEELLAAFHGRWQESVDPLFGEYAY
jgi:glutamate--cysteine ligase